MIGASTTIDGFALGWDPRKHGRVALHDDLVADVGFLAPANDAHARLLGLALGDAPPNPYEYPRSRLGLDSYLRACRISHFSAAELCKATGDGASVDGLPTDPVTGAPVLLPARYAWPRAASILTIAEAVRAISGPLAVRHWWRPASINAAVGGAAGSDHLSASAIDFAASTGAALTEAFKAFLDPLWHSESAIPVWGLSLGHREGSAVVHVGVWAPKTIGARRARRWSYSEHGKPVPYIPSPG